MKRWIVLTNFDGEIDIAHVAHDSKSAKDFVERDFKRVLNEFHGTTTESIINDNMAFIDNYNETYDWLIKEIEV